MSETISMFEWHARMIERAGSLLAHFVETTTDDRRDWQPEASGGGSCRSVLNQADECVGVNYGFAAVLKGQAAPKGPEPTDAAPDAQDVQKSLIASAKELADVVRGLSLEDLRKTYDMGWAMLPGTVAIELPLANMHYHIGQINYVQTLYGDNDFHAPASFMAFDI